MSKQIENKIEEIELKIQAILEPYFVVLDGRCNEAANDTIIEISRKIIEKIYFKDLQQTRKEVIEECLEEVSAMKESHPSFDRTDGKNEIHTNKVYIQTTRKINYDQQKTKQ